MNKSEVINELALALSLAQGEMKPAPKNKINPFFNSAYADLESVIESIKGPFLKHGLSFVQVTGYEAEKLTLTTVLMHKSGQWISGSYPVVTQKNDPQSLGSAVSYAKRYSLSAVLGVATGDDDDGEGAMDRKKAQAPAKAPVRVAVTQGQASTATPGDYVMQVGKFTGQAIKSVKESDLKAHLNFLDSNGKPLSGAWLEMQTNIRSFLGGK